MALSGGFFYRFVSKSELSNKAMADGWNYSDQFVVMDISAGKIFDRYKVTGSQYNNSTNTTVIDVSEVATYNTTLQFKNGADDYELTDTDLAQINGKYHLFINVPGEYTESSDTVQCYFYKDLTVEGLTVGDTSKQFTISSFDLQNFTTEYSKGDPVSVYLTKGSPTYEGNKGHNNSGQLTDMSNVLGEGYFFGNKFRVSEISTNQANGTTTINLAVVAPYHYTICEAADVAPIQFDQANHWYLLSTLTKSNGEEFYYVEALSFSGEHSVSGETEKYYSNTSLDKIGIESPESQTSTKIVAYASDDTVVNSLVWSSNPAINYKEIVEATSSTGGIIKKYGNGSFVEKYSVRCTETTPGQGVITLSKLKELKIQQLFTGTDGITPQEAGSITDAAKANKLLITMTDNNGNKYYALKPILVDSVNNPSELDNANAPIICFNGFSDGDALNENDKHYYTGPEIINVQIVGSDFTLTKSNVDSASIIKYNEGDITKELYTFESTIISASELTGSHPILKTTFKKVSDSPVPHTINIQFYDKKDGTKYAELPEGQKLTGTDKYFFRVRLYDENHKPIAYKIIPLINSSNEPDFASTVNSTGKYTLTLGAETTFTMIKDSTGSVHYDPTVYPSSEDSQVKDRGIEVRLYKMKNNYDPIPTTLEEIEDKAVDQIDGYDFWDNKYKATKEGTTITADETNIRMYSAYKKIYQIKVTVEDGTEIDSGDNILLYAYANHDTSPQDKYEGVAIGQGTKTTENGETVYTFTVEDQSNAESVVRNWTNASDNPQNRISGNEKFNVYINQNSSKVLDGFPVTLSSNAGKNYTATYNTDELPYVDSSAKTTTITHYINIKPVVYERALNPYDVLGDGAEYGVVADEYIRHDHTETNFAVNTYTSKTDAGIDVDASGGGKIPFYVGTINGSIKFAASNTSEPDIFMDTTKYPDPLASDKVHQDSTAYHVNIVNTPEATITAKVNSLINKLKDSSEKYAAKVTMKPQSPDAIDTSMFPDNITIYVDGTDFNFEKTGWTLKKREGQTIVFNIPGEKITLSKEIVTVVKSDNSEVIVDANTGGNGGNAAHNADVENYILNHVVFNAYEAKELTFISGPAGLFIAPRDDAYVVERNGSGTGWIATAGTFDQIGSEWHFFRTQRRYTGTETGFAAKKYMKLDGGTSDAYEATDTQAFTFILEQLERENETVNWQKIDEKTNIGGDVKFKKIEYADATEAGNHYFRVTEQNGTDTTQYFIKSVVTLDTTNMTLISNDSSFRKPNDADLVTQRVSAREYVLDDKGNPIVDSGDPSNTGYKTIEVQRWIVDTNQLESVSSIVFTNSYTSSITYQPQITKDLTEGGTSVTDETKWPSEGFEFLLAEDPANQDGAELPENKNAYATADHRTAKFDAVTFTKVGTYKFTMTEQVPSDRIAEISYNENPVSVIVEIKENTTTHELYVHSVKYGDAAAITDPDAIKTAAGTITNTYGTESYSLRVIKTVQGDTAPAGATDYAITITSSTAMNINVAQDVSGVKNGTTATLDNTANPKTLSFTMTAYKDHPVTVTIRNLSSGTYTVTETTTGGFSTTYTKWIGETKPTTPDTDSEVVLNSTNQTGNVEVLNRYADFGCLKFKKVVQVNHTAPTAANRSLIGGNYTFTIASTTLSPQVTKTVTVTFNENGEITGVTPNSNVSLDTATGEITVSGLEADAYTITETARDNGTSLIGATVTSGSVSAANVATITVTAGNTATAPMATFTNNIDIGNLNLTKTLTGSWGSTPPTVTFTVKDSNDTVVETFTLADDFTLSSGVYVLNDGAKKNKLQNLTVGTYKVIETALNPEGYYLSGAAYAVTTTDESETTVPTSRTYTNGSEISTKVTDGDTTTVAITNTYARKASISIRLTGTKHLDGTAATTANQFTFLLTKSAKMNSTTAANVTLPTGTIRNDASGNFSTGDITFAKDGRYILNLSEVANTSDNTIAYDDQTYEITVVVADGATGYSVTSVSGTTQNGSSNIYAINNLTSKNATFENRTKKGQLKLKKTVSGATLTASKTYYFTVSRTEGSTTTYYERDTDGKLKVGTTSPSYVEVTVPANATTAEVVITDVPFGSYTIAEVNDAGHSANLPGYTLESISDSGTVAVNSEASTVYATHEITNTYAEKAGVSMSLTGTKHLDGTAATTANQFTFLLTKSAKMNSTTAANVTLPTGAIKNDASGNFNTGEITFAKDGIYILDLREEANTNDSTIEYDDQAYEITVVVADGATGYSVTSVSGTTQNGSSNIYAINNLTSKNATFENRTKKGQLKLKKTVSGATLTESKTYYFTVSRTEGSTTTYYERDTDGKLKVSTTSPAYITVTVPANATTAEVVITDVPFGNYTIDEVIDTNHSATLPGYNFTSKSSSATVMVNSEDDSVYATHTITNTYTKKMTNVSVEKVWSDGNDKHNSDSITIDLLRNGTVVDGQSITLPRTENENKVWTYTWTDLDAEDSTGNEITYSVAEVTTNGQITAQNGFSYTPGQVAGGKNVTTGNYSYTITNNKGGETTVSVRKAWFTTNSGTTEVAWPSGVTVEVTLYQNNTAYGTVKELTSGETATWTGLPEKDGSGNTYNYTVAETKVKVKQSGSDTATELPNFKDLFGGSVTGTNNAYTVNNTIKTRDITVTKTWKPSWPDDVSEVRVVLKANGSKANVSDAEATLTDAEASKTWSGLPVYDETGKEIVYSVEETSVKKNDVIYDSKSAVKLDELFKITANPVTVDSTGKVTLENEIRTTSLKVNKVWVFAEDSNIAQVDGTDGKWPKDGVVYVALYRTIDNVETGVDYIELTSSCTSHEFTNLPVYYEEKLATYTVKETGMSQNIDSSKIAVSVDKNTNGDGYTITNREKQAGLTITKHVSGKNLTDAEKAGIVFTVKGEGLPANGVTKTLKDMGAGMTWTLTSKDGITSGKTYTVTESGAAIENYTKVTKIKVNDGAEQTCTDSGNINAIANVTVETSTGMGMVNIWNTYAQDTGAVSVTKAFTGTPVLPEGFRISNNYNNSIFTAENAISGDGLKTPFVWKIDDVPVGTKITFTESNTAVEGYTLSAATVTEKTSAAVVRDITVTVAFVNDYTEDISYGAVEVTKAFIGTPVLPEEFRITNDYNNTIFTPENADSGDGLKTPFVWKIEDVPVGTVITFTESNTAIDGYTLSAATVTEKTSASVVKNDTVKVAFTNDYTEEISYGAVEVTKAFTGTPVLPEGFRITNDYNNTIFTPETAESGDGLKTPFVWKIKDVPVGTVITFTESNTEIEGYILSAATVTEKTSAAVVKNDTVKVAFTNDYTEEISYGAVSVTKAFTGTPVLPEGFRITNDYDNSIFIPETAESGDGLTTPFVWKIDNVPVGTVITFTESNTAVNGYTLSEATVTEKTSAAVVKNDTVTVAFTNDYSRDLGSLQILKNVTVNGKATDGTLADGVYSFTVNSVCLDPAVSRTATVTITNGQVAGAGGDGVTMAEEDGKKYARMANLPTGDYTVAEALTEEQVKRGISLIRQSADEVTVIPDGTGEIPTVEFTNNIVAIKVQKMDILTDEELTGSHIQILDKDGNVVEEWDSDADAPHEVTGLKTGEEYTLRETVAPKGYDLTTDATFSIDENGKVTTTGYSATDGNGNTILLVKDAPLMTTVAVRKVWKDDNNRDGIRPLTLTVRLKANGEVIATRQLTEDNHWTLTEKGLRKYDANGDEIAYTWEEIVPTGYTAESAKTTGMLTTLTNTHIAETTSVSVKKAWNDEGNKLRTRPESIRVQLFANGKAEGKAVILNEANGWAYSWNDLPKYENVSGRIGGSKEIVYTVTELSVPAGYTMSISGNAAKGFVITNSTDTERGKMVIRKTFKIEEKEIEPELEDYTDIPVIKVWEDNNNRDGNRPESVTVILMRGGEEIDRATLTADSGWVHVFTHLPKYENNLTIRYSITEIPVEHYVSSIDGYTITNKYMPTLTTASVRKVWDDHNNRDGMRPASIRMLLSNGMSVTLDESNGWSATITDLPAIVNGKPAEYTWTEEKTAGYTQVSKEKNGNVTTFTNRAIETPNPGKAKTGGNRWAIFEEYDTALGGQLLINHVGDCFD